MHLNRFSFRWQCDKDFETNVWNCFLDSPRKIVFLWRTGKPGGGEGNDHGDLVDLVDLVDLGDIVDHGDHGNHGLMVINWSLGRYKPIWNDLSCLLGFQCDEENDDEINLRVTVNIHDHSCVACHARSASSGERFQERIVLIFEPESGGCSLEIHCLEFLPVRRFLSHWEIESRGTSCLESKSRRKWEIEN